MNGQVPKPFEEILGYLEGEKKIVLMGYGGCTTTFHTDGIKKINDMMVEPHLFIETAGLLPRPKLAG